MRRFRGGSRHLANAAIQSYTLRQLRAWVGRFMPYTGLSIARVNRVGEAEPDESPVCYAGAARAVKLLRQE